MHTHIIIQGTRNIHAHTLCIYKHKFIDMKPALVLRYNTNRKFQQTAVLQSAVQHERRRSQMCYDLFIQHSGLISMQTLTALFLKFPLTLICSFITSPHAGAPTHTHTHTDLQLHYVAACRCPNTHTLTLICSVITSPHAGAPTPTHPPTHTLTLICSVITSPHAGAPTHTPTHPPTPTHPI